MLILMGPDISFGVFLWAASCCGGVSLQQALAWEGTGEHECSKVKEILVQSTRELKPGRRFIFIQVQQTLCQSNTRMTSR